MKLLVLMFLFACSCSGDTENKQVTAQVHNGSYKGDMVCETVRDPGPFGTKIMRCENKEAVCYISYGEGDLNCHFKSEK